MTALVVTTFHPVDEEDTFAGWSEEGVDGCARHHGVCRVRRVFRRRGLDRAMAVTFGSEAALHGWLDGDQWHALLRRGAERGLLRAASDAIIVDGAVLPAGLGSCRRASTWGRRPSSSRRTPR